MKTSVIIATYNAADTLRQQLEALFWQAFDQKWEVIIADNGSTDGTHAIVDEFRRRWSRIHWVDATGCRGAAHARNVGARAAIGENLIFVDADDVVAPGFVAAMSAAIDSYEFVACRVDVRRLNQGWIGERRGSVQQGGLQIGHLHPTLPVAGGGTLGIRRSLHLKAGGFDETFGAHEDTDYCLRVQGLGVLLHFVPDALLYVRLPDTLGGTFRQARAYGRGERAVLRRHRSEAVIGGTGHALRTLLRQTAWMVSIRNRSGLVRWTWATGTALGAFDDAWRVMRSRSRVPLPEPVRRTIKSAIYPRFIPRRFHAYCVGIEKSGTTSVAAAFNPAFRAVHEASWEAMIDLIIQHQDGRLSTDEAEKILLRRDRSLWLELESSWLLAYWIDIYLKLFPEAKFILTIRDPYSWLDSVLNHEKGRQVGPIWSRILQRFYQGDKLRSPPEERRLEQRGFYPLDGYLAAWNRHNRMILQRVPRDRLLVVRTHRLTQSLPQIARFLNIQENMLNIKQSHTYAAVRHYDFLREVDIRYLDDKVAHHCGELSRLYFPEITSLEEAEELGRKPAA